MRLQIHLALDPEETSPEELEELRADAAIGISLSVRNAVRQENPEDPWRINPHLPSMKEKWRVEEDGKFRARVVNDADYARYLLRGNHANNPDGLIHPRGDKPFRFRRRDTGEIVYSWGVKPIDPDHIFRTVPRPYSFRRDVIEYAMQHGSMHALEVMSGRESWRGVLAIRLTRLWTV